MSEETIIRNQEQFKNLMAERREKSDARQVRSEVMTSVDHSKVACQAIKVINSVNIDPFVKKVMTLRVLGPMITGHERTHISIALELGATADDVEQAELYGIDVIGKLLEKVALPEFQAKYARDRATQNAIKGEIAKG
jgi:hypothetical protein